MTAGTRLCKRTIAMSLLLSLILFCGCVRAKPYYYNDSDKIIAGNKGEQPPTPEFNWILMSEGKYRKITTTNPQ